MLRLYYFGNALGHEHSRAGVTDSGAMQIRACGQRPIGESKDLVSHVQRIRHVYQTGKVHATLL